MDAAAKLDKATNIELISPEEFIKRLGIAKSTLHLWRSKGWLMPGRHYIKIGSVVRYIWSEGRLLDIHNICEREHEARRLNQVADSPPQNEAGERINWDY